MRTIYKCTLYISFNFTYVKTDDRKRAEVNTVFPGVFAPTIQCKWEGTMYMAQIFFYPAKQGVLNNWFNRADTVELNSKINQNKGKIKVTEELF